MAEPSELSEVVQELVQAAKERGFVLDDEEDMRVKGGLTHVKLSGHSSSYNLTLVLKDNRVFGYKRQSKLMHYPQQVSIILLNEDESLNYRARSISAAKGNIEVDDLLLWGRTNISFGRWMDLNANNSLLGYMGNPADFFEFVTRPENWENSPTPDVSVDYTISVIDENDRFFYHPIVRLHLPTHVELDPATGYAKKNRPSAVKGDFEEELVPLTTPEGFVIDLLHDHEEHGSKQPFYKVKLAFGDSVMVLDFPGLIRDTLVETISGIISSSQWYKLSGEAGTKIPDIRHYKL